MMDIETQRRRLVDKIREVCGDRQVRVSELVRDISPDLMDWNLFDETMQRGEIWFDGTFVAGTEVLSRHSTAPTVLHKMLAQSRNLSGWAANIEIYLRHPFVRSLDIESKFWVYQHMFDVEWDEACNRIRQYLNHVVLSNNQKGSEAAVTEAKYNLRELLGTSVIPNRLYTLVMADIIDNSMSDELARLTAVVNNATDGLQEALIQLTTFKERYPTVTLRD